MLERTRKMVQAGREKLQGTRARSPQEQEAADEADDPQGFFDQDQQ